VKDSVAWTQNIVPRPFKCTC